jgi:uncharacterized protein YraI
MRMKRFLILVGLLAGLWWGALALPAAAVVAAPPGQAATPTLPALRAEAFDTDVNVRGGPGTDYDRVGTLVKGQSGAILGQTRVGPYLWLKIVYVGGPDNTGWVAADVVRVVGELGAAPTLEAPPTPTLPPLPTSAVTVTVAATFTVAAQTLPTFTAPPPVAHPTLLPVQGVSEGGGFPPAILIIGLLVLGVFGGLISLLRGR